MGLTTRTVIGFVICIACSVLLLYIFFPLEDIPGVSEIFSIPKEKLVRHYACSLALCTHGCPGSENEDHVVNKICLNYEDGECKESCYEYCNKWEGVSNDPGVMCGEDFKMSVSLNNEVFWDGCKWTHHTHGIDFLGSDIFDSRISEDDIFDKLVEKEGFPKLMGSSGDYILKSGCGDIFYEAGNIPKYYPPGGLQDESDYSYIKNLPWGIAKEKQGIGQIFLKHEDVEKYECSSECRWKNNNYGLDTCTFKGNIVIWSEWKDDENGECADVTFSSSTPTPSGDFEFNVTPRKAKSRVGEEVNFLLEIENNFGEESTFDFSIFNCFYNVGGECDSSNLGCDLDCEDNFSPQSITLSDKEYGSSTLTLTPQLNGNYKILVTAKPEGALPKTRSFNLVVLNLGLRVEPNLKEVQKDDHALYNVFVDNFLENKDDFELSVDCSGDCTCEFPDGGSTYTLQDVSASSLGSTTLECWSPNVGDYEISVSATAVNQGDKTSDEATLKVFECAGDIDLTINSPDSPIKSGSEISLKVDGLSGCNNKDVIFAVDDPKLHVGKCTIGEDCDYTDETKTSLIKTYIANSPGTYEIYAKIDIDELEGVDKYSGEGEMDSETLEVVSPDNIEIDFTDERDTCVSDFKPPISCGVGGIEICHYCGSLCYAGMCIPYQVECNDPYCSDPQMCKGFTPSNLCCIYGDKTYSYGPGGIPCLSPDSTINNEPSEYIKFWEVDEPRDLLVSNRVPHGFSTMIKGKKDAQCGRDSDCYGGNDGPSELSDAQCPDPFKLCRLSEDSSFSYYAGWEFIKISDNSRPVYGLKIEGWADLDPPTPCSGGDECKFYYTDWECNDYNDIYHESFDCTWHGYDIVADSIIDVYLHEKNSGWIHIKNLVFSDSDKNEFLIRPTNDEKVWKNIDAILLTNTGLNKAMIDYVGLLTKGDDIPYCMEGDYECTRDPHQCSHWNEKYTCLMARCDWEEGCTGDLGCEVYLTDSQCNDEYDDFDCTWFEYCHGNEPKSCDLTNFPTKTECENQGCDWTYKTSNFYRIVDNGKTCYWDVDCSDSGRGWEGKRSSGIGPFVEAIFCDCAGGECGEGFCKRGDYCYYNVKCANGGWQGDKVECFGTCTAEGCLEPLEGVF